MNKKQIVKHIQDTERRLWKELKETGKRVREQCDNKGNAAHRLIIRATESWSTIHDLMRELEIEEVY